MGVDDISFSVLAVEDCGFAVVLIIFYQLEKLSSNQYVFCGYP